MAVGGLQVHCPHPRAGATANSSSLCQAAEIQSLKAPRPFCQALPLRLDPLHQLEEGYI